MVHEDIILWRKKKPFGTKIIMCLLISWHKRGQWYLWKVNRHGFLWFHINVYVIFNSHKFRRNSTIAYHHNPSGSREPLLKLLLITERQDQLTSKQDKVLNRIKDVYIKYSEHSWSFCPIWCIILSIKHYYSSYKN